MPLGQVGILDRLLKWIVLKRWRCFIIERWTWIGVDPPDFTQLIDEPWSS